MTQQTITDEEIEIPENINASGCRILIKEISSKKDAEIKELKKNITKENAKGIVKKYIEALEDKIEELKSKLEEKEKEINTFEKLIGNYNKIKTSEEIIDFKSEPSFWDKEERDIKPFTIRFIDRKDKRAILLKKMFHSKTYGIIQITNTKTKFNFRRQIIDISYWKEFTLITWKPLNWLSKEEYEKKHL